MPAPMGHEPYNTEGEGGRPIKYDKEFIEKEAEAFKLWMKHPESLYIKCFALERDYHPRRLSEFADVNERFSLVLEMAKAWQEARLVKGGLKHEFHAGFTKFVMSNICGWSEKTETKVSAVDPNNPTQYWVPEANGKSKELVNEPTA